MRSSTIARLGLMFALLLTVALPWGVGSVAASDEATNNQVADDETVVGEAVIDVAVDSEVVLEEIASSELQWTGIAVSASGRIFVSYPRWGFTLPYSVGELHEDGSITPYPDANWNLWGSGDDPSRRFVCVQALWIDEEDRLWILDPANPLFMGVVEDGPKLVCIELATNRVLESIAFDAAITPRESYLNDVRLDLENNFAYISESGLGCIVVLDLTSDIARRRLADHPTTKAEGVTLVIEDESWEMPGGMVPQINVDGIALSPDGEWVYYQALSGRTMYRVPSAALRDFGLSEDELAQLVEPVGEVGASDGILFATDGSLYLSSLEYNAVRRLNPDGEVELVVSDERLRWPDSFSWGPDGALYLTTSLIHLGPAPEDLYRVFRIEGLNPVAEED